jgi:hypothetical protein
MGDWGFVRVEKRWLATVAFCFFGVIVDLPAPIVQAGSKSIVYVWESACWTVVDFVRDAIVGVYLSISVYRV